MSRPRPLHTYMDVLDAQRSPSPVQLPEKPRSVMNVQHSMHVSGQSTRAVNRLPFEVLHVIFSFYFETTSPVAEKVPEVFWPGIYNNRVQQLNPFNLSHVCAYWRAVMFSSPEFWSSLCIIGPYFNMAYAIDIWLTRAEPLLTDIILIQTDYLSFKRHELEDATDGVLSVLSRHSSYWQRLRLEFRKIEYQQALSTIDARKLQGLEAVHLEFPPWTTPGPEMDRLWAKLFQARSLYRVSWEMVEVIPPLHLTRWQQLTWLNCDGKITQSDLWSILKVTPRLIRLRVRGIFVKDPRQPPTLTPFTHSTLQILDLEFKSSPVEFYRNFRTPNLTSLRLAQNSTAWDEGDRTVIGALSGFMRSLSELSNLESLTLIDPSVSDALLITFLHMKQLKPITYLALHYASAQVISLLRLVSFSYRPVLPNLRKFRIFEPIRGQATDQREQIMESEIWFPIRNLLDSRPRGFTVCLGPYTLTADDL